MQATLSKLRNVILCEDIRNEEGGKHSLMGVFAADILVSEFPSVLNLALYVQYFGEQHETGKIGLWLRLMKGSEQLVKGRIEGDLSESRTLTMVIPRAIIPFAAESSFSAEISEDGENFVPLLSRQVLKNPIS